MDCGVVFGVESVAMRVQKQHNANAPKTEAVIASGSFLFFLNSQKPPPPETVVAGEKCGIPTTYRGIRFSRVLWLYQAVVRSREPSSYALELPDGQGN